MTDKKLTDNEIKKALDCHNNMRYDNNACAECPFLNRCDCACEMSENTLDLINRLQAENESKQELIERLQNANVQALRGTINVSKNIAKAEAYKECIEKVKEYYKNKLQNYQFNYDTYCKLCEELDNLLKELMEVAR